MSELIIFDTLGTLLRALICGYATLNTGTYFQRLRFKTTFEMSAFLEYTQDGCREEKVTQEIIDADANTVIVKQLLLTALGHRVLSFSKTIFVEITAINLLFGQ